MLNEIKAYKKQHNLEKYMPNPLFLMRLLLKKPQKWPICCLSEKVPQKPTEKPSVQKTYAECIHLKI